MKDLPVIMATEEVDAALAGKQTQIRVPASTYNLGDVYYKHAPHRRLKPGDRVWVRERYVEYVGRRRSEGMYGVAYGRITAPRPAHMKNAEFKVLVRQPGSMARFQSRLTLEVISARMERLLDISDSDVLASGIVKIPSGGYAPLAEAAETCCAATAFDAFRNYWEWKNGPKSWCGADQVVAITFRLIKENIDARAVAA